MIASTGTTLSMKKMVEFFIRSNKTGFGKVVEKVIVHINHSGTVIGIPVFKEKSVTVVSMALRSTRAVAEMMKILSQGKGFDRVLNKVEVISSESGKCLCEMKITDDHGDHNSTLHAGLMSTLVDMVSTSALMTTGTGVPGVSVDMSVTYLEQAKIGEEIIIDARTIRTGRNLAFLAVEIKNKSTGLLLAKGQHTKFVGLEKNSKKTT